MTHVIYDDVPRELTIEEQERLLNELPATEESGIDAHDKCDHGVYIAKGDTTARYCSACSPGRGIIFRQDRVVEVTRPERDMDAADFMSLPIWERLEAANRMEAL